VAPGTCLFKNMVMDMDMDIDGLEKVLLHILQTLHGATQ